MRKANAISPIIGIILLVAVTVLLVAFGSYFVFDIGKTDSNSASDISVTYGETEGTDVVVSVVKLPDNKTVRVQTIGGNVTVDSVGSYTVDTFGERIVTLGVSSESEQVLSSYEPETNVENNALIVNKDEGVVDNSGYDTLKQAHSVAQTENTIIFESGVHKKRSTVNFTVKKDVEILFKRNTVLSCEKATVNLILNNAELHPQSSIPKTENCESSLISKPVINPSDGIEIISSDNANNVTATVTTGLNYTFVGSFGSETVSGAGNYEINTSGSATVFATGSTADSEPIGSISQDGDSITFTPNKEKVSYNTYLVQPEFGGDGLSGKNVVDSVSKAVGRADAGNSVILLSGTHTQKASVAPTIDKSVTILFERDVTLSCKKHNIQFTSGAGTFGQSPAPNIKCSSLNVDNTATVGDPIAPPESEDFFVSEKPKVYSDNAKTLWTRPDGTETTSMNLEFSLNYNNCGAGVVFKTNTDKYELVQSRTQLAYTEGNSFGLYTRIDGGSSGTVTYSGESNELKFTANGRQNGWSGVESLTAIEYYGCVADKVTLNGTAEFE